MRPRKRSVAHLVLQQICRRDMDRGLSCASKSNGNQNSTYASVPLNFCGQSRTSRGLLPRAATVHMSCSAGVGATSSSQRILSCALPAYNPRLCHCKTRPYCGPATGTPHVARLPPCSRQHIGCHHLRGACRNGRGVNTPGLLQLFSTAGASDASVDCSRPSMHGVGLNQPIGRPNCRPRC